MIRINVKEIKNDEFGNLYNMTKEELIQIIKDDESVIEYLEKHHH